MNKKGGTLKITEQAAAQKQRKNIATTNGF
jgi:hypothetical protein